jgi:hypothetical protein
MSAPPVPPPAPAAAAAAAALRSARTDAPGATKRKQKKQKSRVLASDDGSQSSEDEEEEEAKSKASVQVPPGAKAGVKALCKAVSRCSVLEKKYRDATAALYTAQENAARAARASRQADIAVIQAHKMKEEAKRDVAAARHQAHRAYRRADVSDQSCSESDGEGIMWFDRDSDGDSTGS